MDPGRARPVPASPGRGAAVDEAAFAQLADDLGVASIGEVCRMFVDSARADIDAISRACRSGDAGAAGDAAHRLRSACGFMGATGLVRLCAEVEAGGATDDPAEALSLELGLAAADLDRLLGRTARSG